MSSALFNKLDSFFIGMIYPVYHEVFMKITKSERKRRKTGRKMKYLETL